MDLIDRIKLLDEIENSDERPDIYDGAQEVDWIMYCIARAETVKQVGYTREPYKDVPLEDVAYDYIHGMTWEQLEEKYNLSAHTMRERLKKHGMYESVKEKRLLFKEQCEIGDK